MHNDDRVTSAMQSAVAALRPFADAVFNDNGDMTVILPVVSSEECISAYFARKRLRVALSALVEDQPDMLRLAVAAVLEADKEFRANMMPGWPGDPLSDEIDGLRRVYEGSPVRPTLVEDQPVAGSEWHRSDNSMGGVLLYTLREDGRRRGEPLMVNDVTVRIERAAGSEANIERIVRQVQFALSKPTAAPVGQATAMTSASGLTAGMTVAAFNAIDVPPGTDLYTAPAPAGEDVEPVAYISTSTLQHLKGHGGLYRMSSPKWPHDGETVPLYTSPPALSRKGSDAQTVGGGMATDTLASEAQVEGSDPQKLAAQYMVGVGLSQAKADAIALMLSRTIGFATPAPQPSPTTHRDSLPSDADDMGDGAGGVAKGVGE